MERSPGRHWLLLATSIAAFLTPFMSSSVNIALPTIGSHFAVPAVRLSWVVLAYMLTAAVGLVPLGRLADIVGRRRVFVAGILFDTVFSLLGGVAPSHSVLVLCRAGQGFGGAMIFSTGTAMLSAAFPNAQRGHVLGINVAAVYTGLALGPVLGGVLTHNLGWRAVFFFNVPLAAAALAVMLLRVRGEPRGTERERFDAIGVAIYAVGLVTLMSGLVQLPRMLGIVLVSFGLAGLLAFLLWERRVSNPVLNVRLLAQSRVFLFSNLAALISYSATAGIGFLLSFFLQQGKGLDPQAAGLVLIAQPSMQAVFSPLAGRLSDRVAPRIVASAGMMLTVIGLLQLSFLNMSSTLPGLVATLLLLGVSFAFFSSPNTNAIMGSVEPRFYGVASGTLATMRQVGQMLSIAAATLIFGIVAPGQQILPETYHRFLGGTRLAFAVFAGVCLLGVMASLARGRVADR